MIGPGDLPGGSWCPLSGSLNDPFTFPPAAARQYARRMEAGDAKPLKIVAEGEPVVEPDLDWDDAGIDASGGKDPRSGLPTVLHETPGKDLPEG